MSEDINGPQSGSSRARVSPATACRTELPLLGGAPPRERADATRNRLRVLAAAERLFAERGVAGVTMDDVAAAAGVGKGTLYRRFTDKGGLAVALLDERERELQQKILSGPAPLGPGAEPAERLSAFVDAYLSFVDRQLDLVLMSQTSTVGARLRTGSHLFWRQHCRYLLEQTGAPDPAICSDVLLAGLTAEQVQHWVRVEQRPLPELAAALGRLAGALAAPAGG
jgi:AcrR family transcriptional regulator